MAMREKNQEGLTPEKQKDFDRFILGDERIWMQPYSRQQPQKKAGPLPGPAFTNTTDLTN
jgi:hypothetical protein